MTEEGLIVKTSHGINTVKKEWVEAAWNVLNKNEKLAAKDIPGSGRYRSSFIMAILSNLSYVECETRPNRLHLNGLYMVVQVSGGQDPNIPA